MRVYVRMIMTMLRMQKGAKEKKIQRQKQEDDLPDPDDIELFGDFDEDVVIKRNLRTRWRSIRSRTARTRASPAVAPAWDWETRWRSTQKDELKGELRTCLGSLDATSSVRPWNR